MPFFISSLTHNEQTASNISLLFFLLFYLFDKLQRFFLQAISTIGTNSSHDLYRYLFMLLPGLPFGFYQGMNQMVLATSAGGGGLKMSRNKSQHYAWRTMSDGTVEATFWNLNLTWGLMFLNSFTCLILAMCFDNALLTLWRRRVGSSASAQVLVPKHKISGGAAKGRDLQKKTG